MKTTANPLQFLFAGLYTWVVTTFFGAILLDIFYFNVAASAPNPSETTTMFSEGADFLLLIGALTILSALGALVSTLSTPSARNLFILSILFLVLEFLAPALFSSLIQGAQSSLGFNAGPWVRLIGSALSSILAFFGLWKLNSSH